MRWFVVVSMETIQEFILRLTKILLNWEISLK